MSDELDQEEDDDLRGAAAVDVFTPGQHDVSIRVSSFEEGVGLALETDVAVIDALIGREDVEELCRELKQAAEKTTSRE